MRRELTDAELELRSELRFYRPCVRYIELIRTVRAAVNRVEAIERELGIPTTGRPRARVAP